MSEFEIKLLELLGEISKELHDIKKIQEFNVRMKGLDEEVIASIYDNTTSHLENHN